MRRMLAICRKELQLYFYSPVSYVAFAFYFIIISFFFSSQFIQNKIVDVGMIFNNMTLVFLFIVPLLTMRLMSDELRLGTDELLLTSPATLFEIVFGKYLSAMVVLFSLLCGSLIYPLILSQFGTVDQPVLWLSYLSVFLLGSAMMAVGLFASTLSLHQMISGIVSFAILLVFWLIEFLGSSVLSDFKDQLQLFNLVGRQVDLQKGILNGADVLFYVTFALLFVGLSVLIMERKRLR